MEKHKVVSREDWLIARKEHLEREKKFTQLRDQLSQERRSLPWVEVNKEYIFNGPNGKQSLSDLFDGCSQLLIYHFMLGPNWEEGCPSCSFWADNYSGIIQHLKHRDITMLTVSRAPLEKIESYKKRMNWNFKWVSSFENDFNYDYQVSFSPEQKEDERMYNFRNGKVSGDEMPGVSVFYKDEQGKVFHTYSCYARGLDLLNGAYNYIDLVPKGRDESNLPFTMAWLRRRDQYEDAENKKKDCCS